MKLEKNTLVNMFNNFFYCVCLQYHILGVIVVSGRFYPSKAFLCVTNSGTTSWSLDN